MQNVNKSTFFLLVSIAMLLLIPSGVLASDEAASSGGAASDPTAAVNYQDLRYRYFDLDGGDKNSVETEGAFMLGPQLKITNELRYVETDISGKSEQDFEQLKLKAIWLTPGQPFGVKAKYALGVEWQKNLGDLKEGTGTGADIIAPLAGIGWVASDDDFIVTLVQYFHSYDTDSDRKKDVRETGPRLIWIRSLPDIKGWFKADLKMSINHEDDNDFSQTVELQFGKMFSPSVGAYAELLLGDDVMDTDAYDIGGGLGLRFMY